MQLEAITARLRPRHHWEAIDLGFAMPRHWWRSLAPAWLITLGLLALTLTPLWWWRPDLALLALWWLKPLLDRIPLWVFSRALFGAAPGTATTLAALPTLLGRGWLAALTWQRFDPARSFHLPVQQLEGLDGRDRAARLRLLNRSSGGAGWLTLVCLHFDLLLQLTLLALAAMLFPELWPDPLDPAAWQSSLDSGLAAPLALVSLAIIEPFYVGGGFALYLNRRTWLEGWDLEIGFRQLAQRLRGAAVALTAVVIGLAAVAAQPVVAQTLPVSPECRALEAQQQRLRSAPSEAQRALADVLGGDEFPRCERRRSWDLNLHPQSGGGSTPSLGGALELLLWLAFVAAGLVLGFWLWQNRPPALTAANIDRPPPPGLPVRLRRERFGNDSARQALAQWRAGRRRPAMSLLYRATLARLAVLGVEFDAAATERECLRISAARLGDDAETQDFLRRLTDAWQSLAYRHRTPPDAEIEALCAAWERHFLTAVDAERSR